MAECRYAALPSATEENQVAKPRLHQRSVTEGDSGNQQGSDRSPEQQGESEAARGQEQSTEQHQLQLPGKGRRESNSSSSSAALTAEVHRPHRLSVQLRAWLRAKQLLCSQEGTHTGPPKPQTHALQQPLPDAMLLEAGSQCDATRSLSLRMLKRQETGPSTLQSQERGYTCRISLPGLTSPRGNREGLPHSWLWWHTL